MCPPVVRIWPGLALTCASSTFGCSNQLIRRPTRNPRIITLDPTATLALTLALALALAFALALDLHLPLPLPLPVLVPVYLALALSTALSPAPVLPLTTPNSL